MLPIIFYVLIIFSSNFLFSASDSCKKRKFDFASEDVSPKKREFNPILSEIVISDVLNQGVLFTEDCLIEEKEDDFVAPLQYKYYCMLHALATAITFSHIILYHDIFKLHYSEQTFANVCQHNSNVLITLLVKASEVFLDSSLITDGSVVLSSDHLQFLYEKIPNLPLVFELASIVVIPSKLFGCFLNSIVSCLKTNIQSYQDRPLNDPRIVNIDKFLSYSIPIHCLVGLNTPFGNSDNVSDAQLGSLLGLDVDKSFFTAEISRSRLSGLLQRLLNSEKAKRRILVVLNKEDKHFFCYELNLIDSPRVFCRDSSNNDLLIPMKGDSSSLLEEIAVHLEIIQALQE